MKLPNREAAVIEPEKLTDYLLNLNHRRGGAKARLLIRFGYRAIAWKRLEADIRQYHLEADVEQCVKHLTALAIKSVLPYERPQTNCCLSKAFGKLITDKHALV